MKHGKECRAVGHLAIQDDCPNADQSGQQRRSYSTSRIRTYDHEQLYEQSGQRNF